MEERCCIFENVFLSCRNQKSLLLDNIQNIKFFYNFYFQSKIEKEFVFEHSNKVFDLLDEDYSETISAKELTKIGFLFNFEIKAIQSLFNEFDITGDAV